MCSLIILLINNEPNSEDLGLIPDAEEYGLPSGCLQIQNLKKKLAAYGEVIVLHYKALEQLNFIPDCIFLSGRFAPWDAKTLDTEFCKEMDLIRNPPCPVFGICAGIQLIAAAFGSPCVDMSHPEGEHGYQSLDIICDSVLTKGMDQRAQFFLYHVERVCFLPKGFRLLASSRDCRIQMMEHTTLPIFGTQFHPELYCDTFPDGKKLLENLFARIAIIQPNKNF
jgi:GMP synthase [glutamine-hydrolyzing] subunit A